LILPLIFGILTLGAITIGVILLFSPTWTSHVESTIQQVAINGFKSRALASATFANTALNSYIINTKIASWYIRDVLQLPGSAGTAINTNKSYISYFAAQVENPAVDPPLPSIPTLYSSYYNNNITTTAQVLARQNSDITTVFDNAFRALTINHPTVQAIQAGFEDNGWRTYPSVYNISQFNPRTQSICNIPGVPTELVNVQGYVARCRSWYIAAKAASMGVDNTTSIGLGPLVLSTPYKSSASTGKVSITGSQAFFGPNGMLGVLGLQVNIDDLNTKVTESPILLSGYVFMIDVNGDIVSYPSTQTSIDVFANVTNIGVVEANNNPVQTAALLATIKSASQDGQVHTYQKNGAEWSLASAFVSQTNYYVVAVAPSSDVTALSSQMRKSTTTFAGITLGMTLAATVLCATISYIVTVRQAKKVLTPVAELGDWLTRLEKSDFEAEVGNRPAAAKELSLLHENFKNLLTAVRFGNNAYYANDLSRALANYEAAEKMMIQLKNERGRGVCLNNKGNVYKQMDDRFNQAVTAYKT
ncbi:hypothetical protein HDU76_009747, partial [Blyttiomyces sp. JEL0837]